MSIPKVLEAKIGQTPRLIGCITRMEALRLNEHQIAAFCAATPNGDDLWLMYIRRRDNPNSPKGYDFNTFAKEILARSRHPVTMS